MEISGRIKLIEKPIQVNDKLKKANLILETDRSTDYPQTICVEFVNNSVDILSKYKSGEDVVVSINLRGREWVNPQGETKYFNSINGWKISHKGDEVTNLEQNPLRNEEVDLDF